MTVKFYNDTDNRQCPAVDEKGVDCAAPEGHDGPHANINGEWQADYDGPHCVAGTDWEGEPTGFRTPRQTPCTDVDGGGECHHCPCCCDCMGCLYGPRDGMLLTEEQRAPIAAFKPGTEGKA